MSFINKKNRGFTQDELRKVCEEIAGNKLDELFDYVYTTSPLNYSKYFNYGGLDINAIDKSFSIRPLKTRDALQDTILKSWLRE